jgi:hypothetical protein
MLDAADAVEQELVSAEARMKGSEREEDQGSEREKDQAEEQLVLDVFASATVPSAEISPAKIASGRHTRAKDVVVVPRYCESISRDTMCGLLMGRLQDVSACFVFFVGSFIDNCIYNFYFRSEHALSLTKATERIITEEESDNLRKCLVELEEENVRLKASSTEL